MEQRRPAGVGVGADEAIKFVLGADVDSTSRVKQQKNPAFSEQPFGDGDLLLVAAGELPNSGPKRPPIDVDAFKDRLNCRSLDGTIDQKPAGIAIDNRQRRVVLAAELERQRLRLAILRDEADADIGAHCVGRRGDRDRFAIDSQVPPGEVSHAETGEEEIELTHALKARDTKDLSSVQAE